jgi:hypothetical protein
MKRIVAALAGLLIITGCTTEADEFRSGLPSREMVEVAGPTTGSAQALGAGDRSEFYTGTRNATVAVNASTLFVLGTLKWVTDHRPTSIDGDTAIWGPYKGDSGDGLRADNDWKLTVTRVEENTFSYSLEAKGPSDPDTAWVVVISGQHERAVDANGVPVERFGAGSFLVDWDAAQALPKHDDSVGTALVSYARPDASSKATIDVTFEDVKNNDRPGETVDGRYAYSHTPGNGGTFDFKVASDLSEGSQVEALTIRRRWLQTGAGRADVKGHNGIFEGATINEC